MSEQELTSHEFEVLEMLDGRRDGQWGAWVSACLETLSEGEYCTRGPRFRITEKGKAALNYLSPTQAEIKRAR